jgi:hypothetical protein
VIVQLNPAKWFSRKPITTTGKLDSLRLILAASQPSLQQSSESNSAQPAAENNMSSVAVTPAPKESGFTRFIDAIGHFFEHVAPTVEAAAVAAEPLLALTPFGPEYALVVNAIIGVQKTATASLATSATLTAAQRMALVLEAITPGVTTVLASKGITEPAAVTAAISQFAQNVYNFQAGPVAVTVKP